MTYFVVRRLKTPWLTWVVVEVEAAGIKPREFTDGLIFYTRAAAQAEASARNEFDEVKAEVGTSEENSD